MSRGKQFLRLSVLIPAYNEEMTLRKCVERVLAATLPDGVAREVIVVDDASTDSTAAVGAALASKHNEVRFFRLQRNQGKGAALRLAIQEMSGDLAIFQDADLEYDPRDYARVLKPILEGKAEVVYGSRFTGEERKVLYFWHTAGNRLLTLVSNMLNDTNLTDMETCYKAFTAEALKSIPLVSKRFGIEPEITAKVARNRFRLYEVPISYNGRTYEEGKKITWRDGIAAMWLILRFRFSSNYAASDKVALDSLEQAPKFNQWMYDSIAPYLGGRLAELGAGSGNLSRYLRQRGQLLVTDYREDYLQGLGERFEYWDNVRIGKLDLTSPEDYGVLGDFRPETVVCLNVLEHIENDQAVLDNLHRHLPESSRIVFLVPFNPRLYSEFDRRIGHFRRYQKGELEAKMRKAGFEIERQFFFNKVGIVAWWIGNTLTGQKTITPWQLKVYNSLTPVFRFLDRVLPTAGLSTVVVSRKAGQEKAEEPIRTC